MLRKIFTAIAASCSFVFTSAQIASVETPPTAVSKPEAEEKETKPVFSISGSADFYYKYDWAKSKANNFTSFTGSHNSFSLGMASIKFEHKTDKVDAVLDLGFGPRASEFTYTDNGLLSAVKQLYISYAANDWLKFTAGSWATHVGYELLDPQLNRNYSMSYLFTNGPFSHTGVKADITKGKSGFMLGVANATDYRIPPDGQVNKKFLLAQYSIAASENVKFYLNYVGGKAPDTSKINQLDVVATAKVNDQFNLGLNATVNSTRSWSGIKNVAGKSWWGTALYVNVDPGSWFGLTLRTEYFNDKNHLKLTMAPDGCTMFATTLSANVKAGGFTLIPEFRIDNASKNIFIDKNGASKKSAANVLIAAVYAF